MAKDEYRENHQIIRGHTETNLAQEYSGIFGDYINTGVTDFDFDEIDRNLGFSEPDDQTEHDISMSDVGAAFSLILGWICASDTLTGAGARAAALLTYLDPVNSRFESLADIARDAGLTRATLSKALLELRDQAGVNLSMGKLAGTRSTYSTAQREAVSKGTHCSATRKDTKAKCS